MGWSSSSASSTFRRMSKSDDLTLCVRVQTTAWRVTKDDLRQHERYAEYLAAAEDMLTETDTDYAPWTVVEAHDRRFARSRYSPP